MADIGAPLMLEGSLEERPLSDVLLELAKQSATGILTIQGESDILAVSLSSGMVVSTDSLNRTLEEGLGEVLEQQGWVSAEDYSQLSSEYRAGGGRVIDLLVERDFLSERQLGQALRRHIYRLGSDAFRWREGEYKFYAGEEVSYEECVEPISIEELVVRASRDLGPLGPLDGALPALDSLYRRAPNLPLRDENALTEAESWILGELESPTTARELVGRGRWSEYAVVFYLWRLGRRGVVEAVAASGEPPADSVEPAPPLASVGELEVLDPGPAEVVDLSAPVTELRPVELPESEPAALPVEMPTVYEDEPDVLVDEPEDRPVAEWDVSALLPWVSRAVGALAATLLIVALLFGGETTVLPFPWLSAGRADMVRQRQASSFQRLEQAMETFFLLNGRFPDTLTTLTSQGWIGEHDVVDVDGLGYAYTPKTSTYAITSVSAQGESGQAYTGRITGNFLLDPDLAAYSQPSKPALVLLD